MKRNLAIILAGGSGKRLSPHEPKQFLELGGKPILTRTLENFERHRRIDDIILVTNPDPRYYQHSLALLRDADFRKIRDVLKGGETRQESARIGVYAAGDDYDNVLIHDAARPFVSAAQIDTVLDELKHSEAVTPVIPVTDTVFRVDDRSSVSDIPRREQLKRVQTPQGFRLEIIRKAHRMAAERGIDDATDDCSLIFRLKLADVAVVEGSESNIKITGPLDLIAAEAVFRKKSGS